MKKDLSTKIRKWYESYNTPPPWSSVLGLVVRERKEAQKEERERIIKNIDKKLSWYVKDGDDAGADVLQDVLTFLKNKS